MDTFCLWIGRIVVGGGGIGATLFVLFFVAAIPIDKYFRLTRNWVYFIDMVRIYMRQDRKAAKAFIAGKLPAASPSVGPDAQSGKDE